MPNTMADGDNSPTEIGLLLSISFTEVIRRYIPLRRALVMTSDGNHELLSTCAEYVQWAWPELGVECLEAVETIMSQRLSSGESSQIIETACFYHPHTLITTI